MDAYLGKSVIVNFNQNQNKVFVTFVTKCLKEMSLE